MIENELPDKAQCCAIVGADRLTSRVLRIDTDADLPEYRYTIEPEHGLRGVETPYFRPEDLASLVKLLRVLTRELIHDGGFNVVDKVSLNQFADSLDRFCDGIQTPHHEKLPPLAVIRNQALVQCLDVKKDEKG